MAEAVWGETNTVVSAHARITIKPDKMDGQPCIRDPRFPVVTVLRMVAGGMNSG